jgi:hypothetical protein
MPEEGLRRKIKIECTSLSTHYTHRRDGSREFSIEELVVPPPWRSGGQQLYGGLGAGEGWPEGADKWGMGQTAFLRREE